MSNLIRTIFLIALPFIFYFVSTRWGVRVAALTLLAGAGGNLILQGLQDRVLKTYAVLTALVVLVLNLLAFIFHNDLFARFIPLALGMHFFVMFFRSQFQEVTLIERIASLQKALSPEERRYCRNLNRIWVLVVFGILLLVLWAALFASLGTWTLVTGGLTYAIIGVLFVMEYIIRKWKFGDYGSGMLDRFLKRTLHPLQLRISSQPGSSASMKPSKENEHPPI
ncbi:MAG: hypothetical protein HY788_14675 [Deltaproteobacteria bacterium]|nr:hypothetical protein [Deltaproteobacteria bacterium]